VPRDGRPDRNEPGGGPGRDCGSTPARQPHHPYLAGDQDERDEYEDAPEVTEGLHGDRALPRCLGGGGGGGRGGGGAGTGDAARSAARASPCSGVISPVWIQRRERASGTWLGEAFTAQPYVGGPVRFGRKVPSRDWPTGSGSEMRGRAAREGKGGEREAKESGPASAGGAGRTGRGPACTGEIRPDP
jgi:hypothetical protein